jgi:hypothetical protein
LNICFHAKSHFYVFLYNSRPVFVVLRFTAHALAWEAYVKISAAIEDGAPFKLSWTRTSWYYNVKAKAKEMQTINQILLEDIEHSEGRMDDFTATDYMALDDEDEDEDDEHETFVRNVRERKTIASAPTPAPVSVKATPTPKSRVAVRESEVEEEEVVVRKKRMSAKEKLEAKELKVAEKAAEKALKKSQKTPPTPKASKTKTFTFPVLHDPVRVREHFYDSDGDIITAKADKLRGY